MFELPNGRWKRAALLVAVVSYVAVGIAHFTNAAFFVSIMPAYLPFHLELVWISGFFEILGGLGLLLAPTRRWASWGLIALLVAVYPANIHMLMNAETYAAQGISEWTLWVRMPFQFLFIAWAYWVGKPDPVPPASNETTASYPAAPDGPGV